MVCGIGWVWFVVSQEETSLDVRLGTRIVGDGEERSRLIYLFSLHMMSGQVRGIGYLFILVCNLECPVVSWSSAWETQDIW